MLALVAAKGLALGSGGPENRSSPWHRFHVWPLLSELEFIHLENGRNKRIQPLWCSACYLGEQKLMLILPALLLLLLITMLEFLLWLRG